MQGPGVLPIPPDEIHFLLHAEPDLLRLPEHVGRFPGGSFQILHQHFRIALFRLTEEAGLPIFQQNRLFLMIHSIFTLFLYCSSYPKERI